MKEMLSSSQPQTLKVLTLEMLPLVLGEATLFLLSDG